MNKFIIIAALAQNMDTRKAGTTPVAELTLAGERHICDHKGVKRNIPFYVRAEALGKAAESLGERGYVAGDILLVEGAADYTEWEKEGTCHSTVKLKITGAVRKLGSIQTTLDAGGNHRALGGVNRLSIIGNLAADVEIKTTEAGDSVTNIRLAVNEKFNKRDGTPVERTHWLNATLWREQAEALRGLKKGQSVFVEGALGEETFTDKQSKERRVKVIEADSAWPIVYSGPKPEGAPTPAPQRQTVPAAPSEPALESLDDLF